MHAGTFLWNKTIRGVAVLINDEPHYLDHIGVLCASLDIPLVISHSSVLTVGRDLYPNLKIVLEKDWRFFSHKRICSEFDIIFYTSFYDLGSNAKEIGEEITTIYCPHGNSDKGHSSLWMEHYADEDWALVYGKKMRDFVELKGGHPRQGFISVGNFRLNYYHQHRSFYDSLIESKVLSRFGKRQKTFLYAPTWNDREGAGSFKECASEVIEALPDDCNLIVKPHTRTLADELGFYTFVWAKYQKKENIIFLENWPVIYPLLAAVDGYIGDMSSVGYDFLYFDRPMVFLNPHDREMQQLSQCGHLLGEGEYGQAYDKLLGKDTFSPARQELYAYTFSG